MQKIFTNQHDLPSLTPLGFVKTRVPLNIWNIIQDSYNIIKQFPPEEESFEDLDPKYKNNSHSELFNFKQLESIGNYVIEELKDIHEWWCKESLIPSTIWGFRSYRTNSNMDNHIDWINTHHISSIITVDKDLNGANDWPLHFQSHNGDWHKIYTEPGDMILYESAKCTHGRPEIFQGNYFRNLFMHYRLKDYKYFPMQ
jgi:hypothetical protein